jgi:copper chaperone
MVQLHVPKMSCGGCAAAVRMAVKGLDAEAEVDIDLTTKLVRVESTADVALIVAALAWAGHPAEQRPG